MEILLKCQKGIKPSCAWALWEKAWEKRTLHSGKRKLHTFYGLLQNYLANST